MNFNITPQKLQTEFQKLEFCLANYALTIFWLMISLFIIKGFHKPDPIYDFRNLPFPTQSILFSLTTMGKFFIVCFITPMWEEVIFRVVPIKLLVKENKDNLLLVIIASSMFFGIAHGSVENILMQGVAGLLLMRTYLKCGYPYAVLQHALWNFSILFGFPYLLSA
jgi:membrane protease YdiL (CAAX protease family)